MIHLTEHRADEILRRMRERFVLVLGDVMLDEFVWGDVTRISPEAPVPVVDVRRESVHLGGAANVLANLVSLGARSRVVGVIGRDHAGERLREELGKVGAGDDSLVIDEARPTTSKMRIIAHSQPVVRADREQRAHIEGKTEEQLIKVLKEALKEAHALVVSDYDKGTVTPRILKGILPLATERGLPVLVDPKFRNFDFYRPATLITPNHHEALFHAKMEEDTDDGLRRAAQIIRARLDCCAVLITRGADGMMLVEGDSEPVFVEALAREVYDVTGAGDTVIATLATAMSAGATMTEAAVLATHAAGIVVGKIGTATASADEILHSIRSLE